MANGGGGHTPLGGEREHAEAAQLDLGLIIQGVERVAANPLVHPAVQAFAAEVATDLRKNQGEWARHLIRLNTLVATATRRAKEE